MAEYREVEALGKISSEVDQTQIKVILSTQCFKAQVHMHGKLKKLAERRRETCSLLSSANMKLKFEITQAEQEIKSMLIAQETINVANVELKKESLMAKETKSEIADRVTSGLKKYENLCLESKARYESLPFVQKFLKAKDEVQNLNNQITKLQNDKNRLIQEHAIKEETCFKLDRKIIIELAEYMVNERPKTIKLIKEKSADLYNLKGKLDNLGVKVVAKDSTEKPITLKERTDVLKSDSERSLDDTVLFGNSSIMPKLQLGFLDFDVFNVNLDQVQIKTEQCNKTVEKNNIKLMSRMEIDKSKINKIENTEEYIYSLFNKPSKVYEEDKAQNYAKMRLVNILEDIKVDKNEARKMVANIDPNALQKVDNISVGVKKIDKTCKVLSNKDKKMMESEVIEEIDLTGSNREHVLSPPTQFLDIALEGQKESHDMEVMDRASTSKDRVYSSQSLKSLQEGHSTKKVSFDLPNILETNVIINNAGKPEMANEIETNQTQDGQLDVSDDGFAKIKDMIMKKHNLDLSPQFVYAKNIMTPLKLEDEVVTSKFFQHDKSSNDDKDIKENVTIDDDQVMEINEVAKNSNENDDKLTNQYRNKNPAVEMDIDADIASNPKNQKINEPSDKPVEGFLFSHGAQVIPDSLDISINTTGFEDGDVDFPHCIDSSLLLSPKADFPMPIGKNSGQVVSQDAPNFLTGLRKTGLSFFGILPSSEPKPDSSVQNQGESGFSFNFGGEEKKSRGGLFSMFK